MYKKEFILKQHSPHIHFQIEDNTKGVTLRATEFKPRFDRFLLSKESQLLSEKLSRDNLSLPYRLVIRAEDKGKIDYPKPYLKKETKKGYQAPYFGELKSIEYKSIKIVFYSFNKRVLEAIDNYLNDFLILNNFGNRQSKGFGSYTLEDTTQKEFEDTLKKYISVVYKFNSSFRDSKDALKKIDYFYKLLKSGINHNNRNYKKSLLFQYMCNNKDGYGWEKRFLKREFKIKYGSHKAIDCQKPKEYRYIRALLGLAPIYTFKDIKIKIEHIAQNDDKIERFRSPITFKIFDKYIYLLIDDSYKEILDKEFKFKIVNDKKDKKEVELYTPNSFNLEDFLDFVKNRESSIKLVKLKGKGAKDNL